MYKNAVAMADGFKVADGVYRGLLKELGKVKEARAVDERIRTALIKKADREARARRCLGE
jgi:hypothetical protein